MNVRERLLKLDLVVDNEFLDKYVNLILENRDTAKQQHKTQTHHIIPRSYYRNIKCEEDNSESNLVNLSYYNHILAHYYLAMCAKQNWFKVKSMWAVSYMIGNYEKLSSKTFDYSNLPQMVDFRKKYT